MSMLDKIRNADKAGSIWKPEPGDFIAGEIVNARVVDNQYGKTPVLDILSEEDGKTYSVFLRHAALRSEVERQNANIGDTVGIRYDGEAKSRRGQKYHAYTVIVERKEDAA